MKNFNTFWNWLESVAALRLAGFVFLVVLIVAGICALAGGFDWNNPQMEPSITVSGEGKAAMTPDLATIDMSVEKDAATLATAQSAATDAMNKALDYLKQAGVSTDDIQTTNYSVNPRYNYPQTGIAEPTICTVNGCNPSGSRTLVGYTVDQTVEVKIHDLSKVGDILAGVANAGITDISGPNFTIENPDAVQAQAREKAIAEAKSKAQTLADQLHVHLGRIVSYSEGGNGIQPMVYEAKATGLGMGSSAPTIPAGQNQVTVDVTIGYEIR